MSDIGESFRTLHRIHRQLTDLRTRRDRGPKQIAAHQANIVRLKNEIQKTKDAIQEAKMSADQKQLQLRSKEDKINSLDAKLSMSSTNKEYQALREQIAADKMAISVLEDEILEALTKVDDSQVAKGKAEENLDLGQQEAQRIQKEVDSKIELILNDIKRLEQELEVVEKILDPELKANYQRVVNAKGEDALAELDGENCGGCYQVITINQINHLRLGKPLFCQSCGCLLYLPENE